MHRSHHRFGRGNLHHLVVELQTQCGVRVVAEAAPYGLVIDLDEQHL